mmetsp:Transcript_9040/g.14996  ORF Transcript_9040/g.14996 Transcript_9040/m.14996 type:complete len:366 (+) Transcript_9040:52-1149(+)
MGCCKSVPVEYVELTEKCTAAGVQFEEDRIQLEGIIGKRNIVSWKPDPTVSKSPKAIVMIAHGLNEHSLRYYGIGLALVKLDFAVYSMDHMSHGLSEGRRGVITDHCRLYQDFIVFGRYIKDKHPTLPLFLLCHSMGTLVSLMSINEIQDIQAVVFSGCALFGGPGATSPFGCRCLYPLSQTSAAACVTSITSVLDPGGPAAPLVPAELTSNAEELDTNTKDPRMSAPIVANKSAYELVKLIAKAKEEIPNITVPFVCMHGSLDTVTLPQGSEHMYRHSGTDITRKSLHIIDSARHEPFHESEPIRSEAIAFAANYFESQYQQVKPPQGFDTTTTTTTTTTNTTPTNLTPNPIVVADDAESSLLQ